MSAVKFPRQFVFGVVAAASVSLLLVPRCESVEPTPAPLDPAAQAIVLTELQPVLERALVAYNAGDERAFLAEFASGAPGIRAAGAYRRLFESYYKGEFGKFEVKKLDPKESAPDHDWGALAYDATFQKHAKARIVANFIRENGAVKLMQIRFDYTEPAK